MQTIKALNTSLGRITIRHGSAMESWCGIEITADNPYGETFHPFMPGRHSVLQWVKELEFRAEHCAHEREAALLVRDAVLQAGREHARLMCNLDNLLG